MWIVNWLSAVVYMLLFWFLGLYLRGPCAAVSAHTHPPHLLMLNSLSTLTKQCKHTPKLLLLKNNKTVSSTWTLNYFYSTHHTISCASSLHALKYLYVFRRSYRSWRVPSLFWAFWSRRQEISAKPQSHGGRSTNGSERSLIWTTGALLTLHE